MTEPNSMPNPFDTTNFDASSVDMRKLRELGSRNNITNTLSLVRAFNQATDSNERKALRFWISGYAEWLSQRNNSITEEDTRFLYPLFEMQHRQDEDIEVLQKLLLALLERINESSCPMNLMKSLDYALERIDISIIEGFCARLPSLIDRLLTKLSEASFARATYETDGAMLFTLYQTVVFLQKKAPNVLSRAKRKEIRNCLKKIETKQKYYPIAYQAKLIKVGITKLASGRGSPMVSAHHRAFYLTVGAPNFAQAILAAAHSNLDMDAFESTIQNIKDAYPVFLRILKSRYLEDRLDVIFLATEVTLQSNDFSYFKKCCDKLLNKSIISPFKRSKSTLLHFCMVTQLRWIALNGPSAELRNDAIEELLSWGNKCIRKRWSIESRHVFQAILESLRVVHETEERSGETANILRNMTPVTLSRFKSMIEDWCSPVSAEEILICEDSSSRLQETDVLYDKVRESIGLLLTHETTQFNLEDVRETYTDESFAKVNSTFEDDPRKHVKDFKHDIVCHDVRPDERSGENVEDDHFTENNKRKQRTKETVSLHDLFKPRVLGSDPSPRPVKRVLLVGLLGTGKTTICKSIAYRWATGEIGQEFQMIFLVSIRSLVRMDKREIRNGDTLLAAIAKFCFTRIRNVGQQRLLRMQIEDDLWKPTTLLIIDGLDEGDDVGKAIIQQSLQFNCSLLLTSRPYNLFDIRSHVNVEMECMGLDDSQVLDFVRDLREAWATRLIEFMLKRQSIREIAHVPVTLHIICSLWKEKEERGEIGPLSIERESLYSQMIHLTWIKFVEKTGSTLHESEVLQTLERIAFDAQFNRKVLIDPVVVENNIKETLSPMVFRDAGFLLLKMEGGFYQFPHLSFQENLAGKNLTRLLLSWSSTEKEEAALFISRMKYDEMHSVMLSFMVQEACYIHPDALKTIISVIDKGPRDAFGLKHLYLKLRIVEAYFSANENAHPGMSAFNACLDIVRTGISLLDVCGNNDALTKTLLRRFIKLPNTIRIISKFLPSEMTRIANTASAMHDPEIFARFLNFSEGLENFFDNLEHVDVDWPSERQLDVLASLSLEHIVTSNANHQRRLLNFLVSKYTEEHSTISEKALKLLSRHVGSFPNLLFEVEEIMTRTGHISDNLVLDRCMTLAKSRCAGSIDAIEYLSQKCNHENASIRQKAVENVFEFARLQSKNFSAAWELLIHSMHDIDSNVRRIALSQFEKLLNLFPNRVHISWPDISELIDDSDTDVVLEAMRLLPTFATLIPEHKNEIWELLKIKCRDRNANIKELATSQISRLSELIPDHETEAWELLSSMCHAPECYVRCTALRDLTSFASIFPNRENDAWEILKTCCQDDNTDIVKMSMEQICEHAKRFVEREKDTWDVLLQHGFKENLLISKAAISQIAEIVAHFPGSVTKAKDQLSMLLNHSNSIIRWMVANQSSEILNLFSRSPDEAWDYLVTLCTSQHADVRNIVFTQFSKLAKYFPEKPKEIVDLLSSSFNQQPKDIREHAISQIAEISKLYPENENEEWNFLSKACNDVHWTVRKNAIIQIVDMTALFPRNRDEAWGFLLKLCNDSSLDVRTCAAKHILGMTKAFDENLNKTRNLMSTFSFDVSARTRVTSNTSPEMIGSFPRTPKETWDFFSTLCDARHLDVRKIAVEQMSEMARFCEDPKNSFDLLVECCNDLQDDVRKTAMNQLPGLIKRFLVRPDEIWELLSKLCNSRYPDVRKHALDQISEVSELLSGEPNEAWDMLSKVSNNQFWDVRKIVAGQVLRMAKHFKERQLIESPDKPLEILTNLSNDPFWAVRKSVASQVSEMMNLFPESSKNGIGLLIKLGNDHYWAVRGSVADQLACVVDRFPELSNEVWHLEANLCNDPHKKVQSKASAQLVTVAKLLIEPPIETVDLFSRFCNGQDSCIRCQLSGHITEMIKLLYEHPNVAWDSFLLFCNSHHVDVKNSATSQISEMAKLIYENPKACWKLLSRLCGDNFTTVRSSAANQISAVAKLYPSNPNEPWNLLAKLQRDPLWTVRKCAANQLSELTGLFSEKRENAIDLLHRFCNDSDKGVRNIAAKQIAEVSRLTSDLPNQAWGCISHFCDNCYADVRDIVTHQVSELAEQISGDPNECWDLLSKLCNDHHADVRKSSARAISKTAKLFLSENSNECWDILARLCDDQDLEVRKYAVRQISEMTKLLSEKSDEAFALLSRFHQDQNVTLRNHAVNQSIELSKLYPANLKETMKVLSILCNDQDPNVRKSAASQLTVIAKEFSEHRVEIWEMYKKSLNDPNDIVRAIAIEKMVNFFKLDLSVEREIWDILSKRCSDRNSRVRNISVLQLVGFAKSFPAMKKDVLKALAKRFLDTDVEVRRNSLNLFSHLAKRSPEDEIKIWRSAILTCQEDNILVLEGARGNIVGLTEVNPKTGSYAWKILSDRFNDSDVRVRCSAVDCITELAMKSSESENMAWAFLSEACNDDDVRIKKAALRQVTFFVRQFPERLLNARSLLNAMCNDTNLDICHEAFHLYVGLWESDLQDFPGPSHLLEIAKRIRTQPPLFLVLDVCSRLFGTRFVEEALNVVAEISMHASDVFKEKALKCLEKASLEQLVGLFSVFKETNVSPLLAEQIFLSSTIVHDPTNSSENQFFFFDADGKKKYETPFTEGYQIVVSIKTILSRAFSDLSDTLSEFAAPLR